MDSRFKSRRHLFLFKSDFYFPFGGRDFAFWMSINVGQCRQCHNCLSSRAWSKIWGSHWSFICSRITCTGILYLLWFQSISVFRPPYWISGICQISSEGPSCCQLIFKAQWGCSLIPAVPGLSGQVVSQVTVAGGQRADGRPIANLAASAASVQTKVPRRPICGVWVGEIKTETKYAQHTVSFIRTCPCKH